MTVEDIGSFKAKKKAKLIAKELEQVVKIINLTIDGLSHFTKYMTVMETISVLQNNKTLIEIHLAKFKRLNENKKP